MYICRYNLREFALWILPSSWLSRVDPGSERMPFTWITAAGLGRVRHPRKSTSASRGKFFRESFFSFFFGSCFCQPSYSFL